MRYDELLDAFDNDAQHLEALMSARGVTPFDEVDQDSIDVLRDEGYVIPNLTDFEEVI